MHASLRLQNETFTQSLEYENEILQSNTFKKHIGGQLGIDEHCVFQTTASTLFSPFLRTTTFIIKWTCTKDFNEIITKTEKIK